MSEGSLPPFGRFGPRSVGSFFSPSRAKMGLKRLYNRTRGRTRRETDEVVRPSPALETHAERAVREYLTAQAANLERAERLKERSDRLERDGTPSESARNRAERAREEVVAGLLALRARFVEAGASKEGADRGAASTFDRVIRQRYPALGPFGLPDGRV